MGLAEAHAARCRSHPTGSRIQPSRGIKGSPASMAGLQDFCYVANAGVIAALPL